MHVHVGPSLLLRSMLLLGGGLDKIVVLMEGESLFNDATSIVLFEIFFEMVKKLGDGGPGTEGGLLKEGLNIVVQISWLAAGMCPMLFAHCRECITKPTLFLVTLHYTQLYMSRFRGHYSGMCSISPDRVCTKTLHCWASLLRGEGECRARWEYRGASLLRPI